MKYLAPIINYLLHNKAYRKRKDDGYPGWDSVEVIEQSIREMEAMMNKIALPKHAKVLDMGCGAGNLSFWLESMGFEVFGTDVASEAIQWAVAEASKRGSRVRFSVNDATKSLPFPENSFKLVMDNHSLHCIIGKDRRNYLQNVFRLLKPGGYYLVSTMCYERTDSDILLGFDSESRCLLREGVALRYLGTAQSIQVEIASAGFSILHSKAKYDEEDNGELLVTAQKPNLH